MIVDAVVDENMLQGTPGVLLSTGTPGFAGVNGPLYGRKLDGAGGITTKPACMAAGKSML
jgi:hypothetical protein